ncbi:uncharacterized protein LOC142345470 isoform X2 [Convolutriloba macropyga]|uniref:uncharacterized protein LOC142345470 isoform X2 n=1 Tax=Convolutriloba macropyga TaxID=536237 RepID=UPI003F5200B1
MFLDQTYCVDSCDSTRQEETSDSACSSSSASPPNGESEESSKLIQLKRAVDIGGRLCDMIREDGGLTDFGEDSGTESDVEDILGDRMVDCGAPVQFLSIDFCDSSSDEERDSSTGVNSALYGSFTDLHRLTDQSMMEQKNNCSYYDLSSDEEPDEPEDMEIIVTDDEVTDMVVVQSIRQNKTPNASLTPLGREKRRISRQVRYSDTSLQMRRCWRGSKTRQVKILPTLQEVSKENSFDDSLPSEQSQKGAVDFISITNSTCDVGSPWQEFPKRVNRCD